MTDNLWQWCEVFNSDNAIEAHLIKGLLEQANIDVLLKGEALLGALCSIQEYTNCIGTESPIKPSNFAL